MRAATERTIEAMMEELIGPLLHARPSPNGFRLAGWDVEQGLCITIARGDEWVLIELEERDESRDCHARTARFNVCARYQFRPDQALGNPARRAVDQLVELVRRREEMLPRVAREEAKGGSEVREILVDRVLMAQAKGHYYLNPYVGCMIGCAFCYVADRAELSRKLEGRARYPWGRYVDVKVNAPEVLARELANAEPGFVRMSPILTDPYQPLEKKYRITRGCLEKMIGTGFVPGVLTRGARVREDVELLARIPRAAVGMSIPTDDDSVRRAFEPGADSIEARIEALAACHAAGIMTVAVVQPMLPMNPERLAAMLAPHVRAVRVDRMHRMDRALPLYQAAGRLDASSDAFFAETSARLLTALASHGVSVDPLDDLGGLLA